MIDRPWPYYGGLFGAIINAAEVVIQVTANPTVFTQTYTVFSRGKAVWEKTYGQELLKLDNPHRAIQREVERAGHRVLQPTIDAMADYLWVV